MGRGTLTAREGKKTVRIRRDKWVALLKRGKDVTLGGGGTLHNVVEKEG